MKKEKWQELKRAEYKEKKKRERRKPLATALGLLLRFGHAPGRSKK